MQLFIQDDNKQYNIRVQYFIISPNTNMKLIANLSIIMIWMELGIAAVFSGSSLQPDSSVSLQPKNNSTMTFQQFKQKYSKTYASVAEENYRCQIFSSNIQKLNIHNSNPARTYNMITNSFLDIAQNQFKDIYTTTRPSTAQSRAIVYNLINKKENKNDPRLLQTNITNSSIFTGKVAASNITKIISIDSDVNVDWTMYSGTVKDQGLCGSCYAFAAADTTSALNAINIYSFFVPLSAQQIVDCIDNGLTYGCNGGYLQGAFTYIQLYGITTAHNYPYSSGTTGNPNTCLLKGGPFKLSSFQLINAGDCKSIVASLASGPVSAGIAGYNLQFYEMGIFNDCDDQLDHAILIVGYRSGMGWKIKNSWGTGWGEKGYAWIAEDNTCGICKMAVQAYL